MLPSCWHCDIVQPLEPPRFTRRHGLNPDPQIPRTGIRDAVVEGVRSFVETGGAGKEYALVDRDGAWVLEGCDGIWDWPPFPFASGHTLSVVHQRLEVMSNSTGKLPCVMGIWACCCYL
jgi:hypothetical protein